MEEKLMNAHDLAQYCIDHIEDEADRQPITVKKAEEILTHSLRRDVMSPDVTPEGFADAWNAILQNHD